MTDRVPDLPRTMSAGASLTHKVLLQITKAALSSIPLSGFVLDVGLNVVEFANARVVSRFVSDLASRLAELEDDKRERLLNDPLHSIAAHAALRVLLTESNERVAVALARAVAELAKLDLPQEQKAECARIIGAINEPMLHCLQTCYRFRHGYLSEVELEIRYNNNGTADDERSQLHRIIYSGIPILGWVGVIDSLIGLGLLPKPQFHDFNEEEWTPNVTELGERILNLYIQNPCVPMFGVHQQIYRSTNDLQ